MVDATQISSGHMAKRSLSYSVALDVSCNSFFRLKKRNYYFRPYFGRFYVFTFFASCVLAIVSLSVFLSVFLCLLHLSLIHI